MLDVAHSLYSEGRMTQSSWLHCQERLSQGTRETPWLYNEAHLDKKHFFTPSPFSGQPCAAAAQWLWLLVHHQKVQQDRGKEAAATWEVQGHFQQQVNDELAVPSAPLIRDTAKKSLLSVQTA